MLGQPLPALFARRARSQIHDDIPAGGLGRPVRMAVFLGFLDHPIENITPPITVSHFPPAEKHASLYFTSFLKECNRMTYFCLKIVVVDVRMKLDFLQFVVDLLLSTLAHPLALLVHELAIVHDPTDNRSRPAIHLDQVEASGACLFESLFECDYADVAIVRGDQPDLFAAKASVMGSELLGDG